MNQLGAASPLIRLSYEMSREKLSHKNMVSWSPSLTYLDHDNKIDQYLPYSYATIIFHATFCRTIELAGQAGTN